jgi:hypothetical protein
MPNTLHAAQSHAPQSQQSRRAFLRRGVAAGLAASSLALAGCSGPAAPDRQLVFPALADALRELDRLKDAVALDAGANWTWSKTLLHLAQSIDYSMSGYPEQKSALFQHTAGAAAFTFFSSRGRMSHNLIEAIPGGATLDANAHAQVAVATLRKAVATFLGYDGALQPHFAYGELTKPEYERAHAMHIANHLSVFDARPLQPEK